MHSMYKYTTSVHILMTTDSFPTTCEHTEFKIGTFHEKHIQSYLMCVSLLHVCTYLAYIFDV